MTDVLMDIITPEKPKADEYFIQKVKELQDKLPAYKPSYSEPPFYIPKEIYNLWAVIPKYDHDRDFYGWRNT